jgi:hypothetical protein
LLTLFVQFKRGWIVQEVGTRASSTIFWGDAEIDWEVLYNVCEELTHYHHLRTEFDIRTSEIKFLFQRFVEPDASSYHANRFNFIYELHRARGLKFTDQHDRIFAFLGHYALGMVDSPDPKSVAIQPDYTKTVEQVYIDVAKWALKSIQGSSALIALAAVQHLSLPSRHTLEKQQDIGTPAPDKNRLPSWVSDWRTYQGFILSEPINPHRAHGSSKPKLEIDEDDPILQIQGLEIDTIEACSRVLDKEFHKKADKPGFELTVEYLWREICQKGRFNLSHEYLDGQKAFFAFMQTLSNGCVQIAGRGSKSYDEISESRWLEQAALYLKKFICRPDMIAPELLKMAEQADRNQVKEEWSRSANGASKNRIFARTRKGYYILGPAVMEVGDVVCVLFGGKMPFCLRPMGQQYMLGGECYAHGLMKGEAIDMMDRNKLVEKDFKLV